MPIYEYKCASCGHRFDVLQRIGADGSDLNCPNCGAQKPEKMLSACATSGSGSESYSAPAGRGCSSGFG
jgi:putative FmdB family regulatory protein